MSTLTGSQDDDQLQAAEDEAWRYELEYYISRQREKARRRIARMIKKKIPRRKRKGK